MRISVAVPSYNYGQYIQDCLDSLIQQDYANYEVLIADAGSTDNSLEVIQRFCERDARFSLVSTSDRGQADAIQKAVTVSTGEIFCFLNADDKFICRDALSAVARAFHSYGGIEIVSFQGYYLNAVGNLVRPVKMRYHPLDNISLMAHRTAVLQPATFWRREVSMLFPLETGSHYAFDSIFFYKVYKNCSWLELAKPLAGHRLHGDNKSLRICSERIRELVDFERLKFGDRHIRVIYISLVLIAVLALEKIPVFSIQLRRALYFLVNSMAYFSCYRLPGI